MQKKLVRIQSNKKPAFQKPDVKAELKRLQRLFGLNFPGALEPWMDGEEWAKPLAVGFKQEARTILTPNQMKALEPVLKLLIQSRPYQKALAADGSYRVNYDGKKVEAVEPAHQLAAQVALLNGYIKMLSKQVNPETSTRDKLWVIQKQVAEIKKTLRVKNLADLKSALCEEADGA